MAFVLAIVSYISIRDQQDDIEWVDRTEQIVNLNNHIQQSLVDAETAERGYVITEDNNFKEDFNKAVALLGSSLTQLQSFMRSEDRQQAKNVDSLAYYVSIKLHYMEYVMNYADKHIANPRELRVRIHQSRAAMDKVRRHISQIASNENFHLQSRKEESLVSGRRTMWIGLIGTLVILISLVVTLKFILDAFGHQKLIEEKIRDTNFELRRVSAENERRNWLLAGSSQLDAAMRGELEISQLSSRVVTILSEYTGAQVGAFYLAEEKGTLSCTASYALATNHHKGMQKFKIGEGLVGQVALEMKPLVLQELPENYIKVVSGTGEATPGALLIQPVVFEDRLKAVVELGYAKEISEEKRAFINEVVKSIGVAINTVESRVRLRDLFEKTQQQAEELESHHEELRTTNEELVRKTHLLQASEEELTVQQEELRQANAELEEKAEILEEQNRTIQQSREAIALKARELEQISRYKSEFLANMSHELRTPLNSILILARILNENKQANLSEEQVKYAGVIQNAGKDLLALINDILDLAKIESGKVDLNLEQVEMQEVKQDIELLFSEVANNKNVSFSYSVAKDLPPFIVTDKFRLEQILKNLLSNAFKFTPANGRISVNVGRIDPAGRRTKGGEPVSMDLVEFSVVDTGIGIPPDKLEIIFEAFKQADGSTSRKYGGTGLGLSICRELVHLLGGEIEVKSNLNEGSEFIFYIPLRIVEENSRDNEEEPIEKAEVAFPVLPAPLSSEIKLVDQKEGHKLLIVEDDETFSQILKDYASSRGFVPLLANSGDVGLQMAKDHLPDAIVLDIMLPLMDGWTVLKKLKEDQATKNIPVHLLSARDETPARAKKEGALGFLRKPVDKAQMDKLFDDFVDYAGNIRLKKVLVVEDQVEQSDHLATELRARQIEVSQAFTGKEMLAILAADNNFDCIILDLRLPDVSGIVLLEQIKQDDRYREIPVVINTAMELGKDEMSAVMKYTNSMVLKSNKSNDRLLDEVNLFMKKVKTDVAALRSAPAIGRSPKNNSTMEKALKGKSVLVVDDDMRNVFALASVLEEYELKLDIANNGKEALAKLDHHPETDLVLMDLMMPVMDGYQAMREIRAQPRFRQLPIIAFTAKAMKNDREECIEAGANDYISKPIEVEKLLSMMRVWIS